MKPLLPASLILFVIILGSLPSCTKETVRTETIRDTVAAIPLTTTQILSKYKWAVYESFQVIKGVSSSDTAHYLRGKVNTINGGVDVQRLTFNANGTGTYLGGDGLNYTTTWLFTSPDEQNMKLVVTRGSSSITYNWSLINIRDSAIYQTTAASGMLVSAKWIPSNN
ncbi:MAG: hypothetical protein J0I41_04775 [Filimonas sp.]|nr:hypothetical protein [Filimonas sp.]